MVVCVGGAWLAVDAALVERVGDPMPVTALPRSPAHIEGLMLIGARALPVLDLCVFLGLQQIEADDEDRPERVVVLTCGELRAAVRCSQVNVVRDIPLDRFGPIVVTRGVDLKRYAEHEVEIDGAIALVLDLRSALEAARVRRA